MDKQEPRTALQWKPEADIIITGQEFNKLFQTNTQITQLIQMQHVALTAILQRMVEKGTATETILPDEEPKDEETTEEK